MVLSRTVVVPTKVNRQSGNARPHAVRMFHVKHPELVVSGHEQRPELGHT